MGKLSLRGQPPQKSSSNYYIRYKNATSEPKRGSGLSWGLAEDDGLVARLLSEVGLPGSETIALNLKKLAFLIL